MSEFISYLKKSFKDPNIIFFILTLIAGIVIVFPYHDFQLHLAQGDHGQNLYCFRKTLEGARPYQDYWWVYGPLMPYYYCLFFRLFGVSIHSVLVGYVTLQFLAGIFVFWALRIFIPHYMAFAGAVWFWVFNSPFEFTYNHAGGILTMVIIILILFRYIKEQNDRYLFLGFFAIIILSLIKINFGFSCFISQVLSVYMIDRFYKRKPFHKRCKWHMISLFIVPLVIFLIYWILTFGLSIEDLRECFPYGYSQFMKADRVASGSAWQSLILFFEEKFYGIQKNYLSMPVTVLFVFSLGLIFYRGRSKKLDEGIKTQLWAVMSTLFIFSIFNLHEFFPSGVGYRTFWIKPFEIIGTFIIISGAMRFYPKMLRILLCFVIVWISFFAHYQRYRFVQGFKNPLFYISNKRGQVYVGNSLPWLNTVRFTTRFLLDHLQRDETFLAVVYEPIYYFLTDKDSPHRRFIFLETSNISTREQLSVIRVLEKKKINYVLLSNRCESSEPGVGKFGKTYCHLLSAYLMEHYAPVVVFGEWDKPAEWIENHAVMILEKKKENNKEFPSE